MKPGNLKIVRGDFGRRLKKTGGALKKLALLLGEFADDEEESLVDAALLRMAFDSMTKLANELGEMEMDAAVGRLPLDLDYAPLPMSTEGDGTFARALRVYRQAVDDERAKRDTSLFDEPMETVRAEVDRIVEAAARQDEVLRKAFGKADINITFTPSPEDDRHDAGRLPDGEGEESDCGEVQDGDGLVDPSLPDRQQGTLVDGSSPVEQGDRDVDGVCGPEAPESDRRAADLEPLPEGGDYPPNDERPVEPGGTLLAGGLSERLKDALGEALFPDPKAVTRWEIVAVNGATDADLQALIAREFQRIPRGGDRDWWAAAHAGNPVLGLGPWKPGAVAVLKDVALVAAARELLRIPEPQPLAEKPKAKAKTTKAKNKAANP